LKNVFVIIVDIKIVPEQEEADFGFVKVDALQIFTF
jgi:hypothetical protein